MTSEDARDQQYHDHKALEAQLQEQIQQGGFSIALSGGGHRASLAALGALLALVDRRLNRKVIQIASISGGSITNAFVAQRCAFEKLEPGEFDRIASELARTIVERGVLTQSRIVVMVAFAVILGAVVAFLLVSAGLVASIAIGVGVIVAFSLLMTAGKMIDWLLDQRYFQLPPSKPVRLWKPRRRARISSLIDRHVDHVFGMTDLVLGLPVYVSSQQGGMLWRQLARGPSSVFGTPKIQTCNAGDWSISETVRASAAFPGIPPRRVLMPSDHRNPDVAAAPSVTYLADGGMWNNLGTQVLREDKFLGVYAARENGVPRPYAPSPDMPLLVINGSANLRPSRPWKFNIPGLALLAALLQSTRILNANTVVPRVNAMARSFEARIWRGRRPDHFHPLDLVVDLSEPQKIFDKYNYEYGEEQIRLTDERVKEWERNVLLRVRLALQHAPTSPETDWLQYILRDPEPQGSCRVAGFATDEDWNAVRLSPAWKDAVTREADGGVDVPTTLGRIDATLARRLIARGYLNTFLVSLYLGPLWDCDLEWLGSLSQRLDHIVPRATRPVGSVGVAT